MDMECDEVNPTVVEAAEVDAPEVVNCGGGELRHGGAARSSDSPAEDGSRPTSPEVNMLIHATGQLTIFCAGSVHVFDGISPEKVNEIMLIAAAAANSGEKKKTGTASPVSSCPSLVSTAAAVASPQAQLLPCKLQAGLGSELPIARRHSLQRFFEKRRDRLVSKSPYTKPASNTKTRMDDEPSSPDAGCFGKSSILAREFQTGSAARLA